MRIEQQVIERVKLRYITQPKQESLFFWLWAQLEQYESKIECRAQKRYIGFYANKNPNSIFAYLDLQQNGLLLGIFDNVASQLNTKSLTFRRFPRWNSRGLTGILLASSNIEILEILKKCHYISVYDNRSTSFHVNSTSTDDVKLNVAVLNDDLKGIIFEQETLEGNKRKKYINFVERDSNLRKAAIAIHGISCMICGFDFEKAYGELGTGYVEVHHLYPLGQLSEGESIATDPKTDMAVVCSNCHRILHRRRDQVLQLEELKAVVKKLRACDSI